MVTDQSRRQKVAEALAVCVRFRGEIAEHKARLADLFASHEKRLREMENLARNPLAVLLPNAEEIRKLVEQEHAMKEKLHASALALAAQEVMVADREQALEALLRAMGQEVVS